jgi:type III pantothenate kinase
MEKSISPVPAVEFLLFCFSLKAILGGFLMLLVVDVGNTNTVLGIYRDSVLTHHWRLTSGSHTADELGLTLLNLLGNAGIKEMDISGVVVSSVVPPMEIALMEAIRLYLGNEALFVSTALDLGLEVRYKAPHEVGADRLVNAVAGVNAYGAPLIIVDFGTAITLDVVSADKAYLGGAIAPGMALSMEALFGKTARLPKVSLSAPESVIGRTTMESIQAGIMYGTAGLIDTLVKRIWAELGRKTPVVATGGQAESVSRHTETIDRVDPWLTLEGLRLIYERNRGNTLE